MVKIEFEQDRIDHARHPSRAVNRGVWLDGDDIRLPYSRTCSFSQAPFTGTNLLPSSRSACRILKALRHIPSRRGNV